MPPDWDEDSAELHTRLASLLRAIVGNSVARPPPSLTLAVEWHRQLMEGFDIPLPQGLALSAEDLIGCFRGPPRLMIDVSVGPYSGVAAADVAAQLKRFEETLQLATKQLDALIPAGERPTKESLPAVLDLCGWAHAEWVRIHPFGNGNGRTARLWANWLALRYGLPPFVRLRPRPTGGYDWASAEAMQGNWRPTAAHFRELYFQFVETH